MVSSGSQRFSATPGYPVSPGREESGVQSKPSLRYRPDIDGLRAVAVLAVLAFHVGLPYSSGGFVGVDIFFVISGYLISSIILSQIKEDKFSLPGFYERRIKRILPALTVMVLATCVMAYNYLLPTELEEFAKSLLAADFSLSNFYFWKHSSYFVAPLSSPLLHTWSLAVEEQFYLGFPIYLMVVQRWAPKRLTLAVCGLALASFALSAFGAFADPVTTFYMPYTRVWELLVGTLLSLRLFPKLPNSFVRNLVAVSGAGMIAASLLLYSKTTPFPGLAALLPCLGSALIIGAGESGFNLASRALSFRPVVFVGLISYSLYLWHWPIIVFRQMGAFYGDLSAKAQTLELLALSFLAAVLSWRFIEKPFRTGPFRLPRRSLFQVAACSLVLLAVLGLAASVSKGLPQRFPPAAVKVAGYLSKPADYRTGSCFITSWNTFSDFDKKKCVTLAAGKHNILLLGDSHAASLWHGLADSFPNNNVMQATAAGCAPLVGGSPDRNCRALKSFVFGDFLLQHHLDQVVLVGRWEETQFVRLGETIAWLKSRGIPVVVIGPTPEYDAPLPRLIAYGIAANDQTLPNRHRVKTLVQLDHKMQDVARATWHVPYISLVDALCNPAGCAEYADHENSVPLMFDTDHFSNEGARFVVARLVNTQGVPLFR